MKSGRLIWGTVILCLFLTGLTLLLLYALAEPGSLPGHLLLRAMYDPEARNLENISSHLRKVEGGHLPDRFDAFLLRELDRKDLPASARGNIIGFYALQSRSSRAGSGFWGRPDLVPLVVEHGLQTDDMKVKEGCVFLAVGIRAGSPPYKPYLHQGADVDHLLRRLQAGEDVADSIASP